jgi:hypothetical protein
MTFTSARARLSLVLSTALLGLCISAGSASAAGLVIVSGDDADDGGHCQGSRCGQLYGTLFTKAVDVSATGSGNILSIVANSSRALTALNQWTSTVHGGPGVTAFRCNSSACIDTVNFPAYAFLFLSSGSNHTRGGMTTTQLARLNLRASGPGSSPVGVSPAR